MEDKYESAVNALYDETVKDFLKVAGIFVGYIDPDCSDDVGVYLGACDCSDEVMQSANNVNTTIKELFSTFALSGYEFETIKSIRDQLAECVKLIDEELLNNHE